MVSLRAFTLLYAVYCAVIHGAVPVMTLFPDKLFVDIHTHNDAGNPVAVVDNGAVGFCSVGIHPWRITEDWEQRFLEIRALARQPHVVAVGECGFDYLKSLASKEVQYELFKAHALLAEEIGKPLIIHLVKGQQELLRASKEILHKQAWIIHGFRGKPLQALQLLSAGMYISLGEMFNSDAASVIPLGRLFIESDESAVPIAEIYEKIANVKGVQVGELARCTIENARACNIFFADDNLLSTI